MPSKPKYSFNFALISISALIILQIINFLVVKYFPHQINSNLFFGLAGNNTIAIIISVVVLISFLYFNIKNFLGWGLVLVVSGLLSNVLDRFIYGGAVDYFDLFFVPKFNLADILIIIGAFFIGYKLVRTI